MLKSTSQREHDQVRIYTFNRCGWNTDKPFSYLAPVLYQNTMGMSRNLSLILGGATAIVFLFASVLPLWVCHNALHWQDQSEPSSQTVDRFGRRPLLMISAAGQSFCFMMTAILLSIGTRPTAYGATAMIFLFQICLGAGYLPIVSLYSSPQRQISFIFDLALAIPIWDLNDSHSFEGRCHWRVHTMDG